MKTTALCALYLVGGVSFLGRAYGNNGGGACSGGTGLPQSFSKCNYESLSAYRDANPSDADAWAEGALKEFIRRRRLDCEGTVNDVLIVCENEYQSRAYALVADVSIPCYKTDRDAILLQARIYEEDGGPRFEQLDDICRDDDDRRRRDDDYDDDDDDDDDDD